MIRFVVEDDLKPASCVGCLVERAHILCADNGRYMCPDCAISFLEGTWDIGRDDKHWTFIPLTEYGKWLIEKAI